VFADADGGGGGGHTHSSIGGDRASDWLRVATSVRIGLCCQVGGHKKAHSKVCAEGRMGRWVLPGPQQGTGQRLQIWPADFVGKEYSIG